MLTTTLCCLEMPTGTKSNFQMAEKLKDDLLVRIEKEMETADISQGEVARRMGALRSNINKVMRRKFPVTIDFLLKMAESIGLQVELKVKKSKP